MFETTLRALRRATGLGRPCSAAPHAPVTWLQTKTISNLERAIAEAKKQCDEASAGECAAAWDTVEELSAAIADKKASVRGCREGDPWGMLPVYALCAASCALVGCRWRDRSAPA